MTTTEITMTKLTASDGMMLTNGESYGKTVYLGKGDSLENWREITDTEYEDIMEKTNDETELSNDI